MSADHERLRAALAEHFGTHASVIAGPIIEDAHALIHPEERAATERAVAKRKNEHATGRLYARRLFEALGVGAEPLMMRPDRRPEWPAGVVGSISHTADACAVVVARANAFRSLALDVEGSEPLGDHLLPHVTTAHERAQLAALSADDRGVAAKILFSAKETFYKLQSPLTGVMLDFADVELEVDLRGGRFEVRRVSKLANSSDFEGRVGFVWRSERWVATGMMLPVQHAG